MEMVTTELKDLLLFKPQIFGDERGFFFESFNERAFQKAIGTDIRFVQDNHSRSEKNVVRGLHYQVRKPQGKLVRVAVGAVYDVVVDLRRQSPTFGQSTGFLLSAENRYMLWVPPGFAHGFAVVSDTAAEVLYKTTDYWAPEYERILRWDDPELSIEWPIKGEAILSDRDQSGVSFAQAEVYQ